MLSDIKAQLQVIGNQVAEVNQRTIGIQKTLDEQRMEMPRIASALASANVSALKSLTDGGIQANILEEAFRQTVGDNRTLAGRRFFDNSIGSAEAMAWLDAALAKGIDPNITLPSETTIAKDC